NRCNAIDRTCTALAIFIKRRKQIFIPGIEIVDLCTEITQATGHTSYRAIEK
ncbi:25710_t:CDS:1, partial [Gigaspora rosea]